MHEAKRIGTGYQHPRCHTLASLIGAIRASVRRTGRLVVADEAGPTCGASAEICALVTEDPQTFRALKAPVRRVCALEAPIPYTPVLESHVFPNRDRIASAVREALTAA